jgi:NIPSNAP
MLTVYAGRKKDVSIQVETFFAAPPLPSRHGGHMLTLSIRYTLDPNKIADFKAYAAAELEPISRSGGHVIGYFLPTEFSGPTNEALGLIEFPSLAEYEEYRGKLASDPDHKKYAKRLEESGVIVSMNRSIIQRVG